jgi:hypothetical protein
MIGCCYSGTLPKSDGTTVKINLNGSESILISGDSAKLDYDAREVVISSPKEFGFANNGLVNQNGRDKWVVVISIRDNKLIASMPEDGEYKIWINGQYNLLPNRKQK